MSIGKEQTARSQIIKIIKRTIAYCVLILHSINSHISGGDPSGILCRLTPSPRPPAQEGPVRGQVHGRLALDPHHVDRGLLRRDRFCGAQQALCHQLLRITPLLLPRRLPLRRDVQDLRRGEPEDLARHPGLQPPELHGHDGPWPSLPNTLCGHGQEGASLLSISWHL